MVAQQHHAPSVGGDDDDVFDRVFTSFESTILPYIMTDDSHALGDDGAPILDYVCENVEQFTCRNDAPHLLLEEQVANALGVPPPNTGGDHQGAEQGSNQPNNNQYSIDRDNSLIEHDRSTGEPVIIPTTKPVQSPSVSSTSSTTRAARGFRAKSRVKIQPCGAEGDILDYVFEETERHTCGSDTGAVRVGAAGAPVGSRTAASGHIAPPAKIEPDGSGGGGDPPGIVLCGNHGSVIAASAAAVAAAATPCWTSSGGTNSSGTLPSVVATNKTKNMIQPCGSEGDVLDYAFENTEQFTCGEKSVPTGKESTMPSPSVPSCGRDDAVVADDGGDSSRNRRGQHKELTGIEAQRLTVEPTPQRKQGILGKLSNAATLSSSSRRRRGIKSKKSQDSVESSSSSSSEEIQLFFRPQRS